MHGYNLDMGILIAILVVLAIIALVLYIARTTRMAMRIPMSTLYPCMVRSNLL